MEISLDLIPNELKKYPNWVNWRTEKRDGKDTKIPINPKTGGKAQTDNPQTWGTYHDAVKFNDAYRRNGIKGLGFVFSGNGDLSGIDLDKCKDPESGKIEAWATEIVTKLNSYTEVTPSGTGLHVWVKGKLPPGGRRKGNVEMYDKGRYFTVTGQHLEGTVLTIESREAELREIHAKYIGNHQPSTTPKVPSSVLDISDSDLIEKAKKAENGDKFIRLWAGDWRGYHSQSEADLALCLLLSFWTGRDAARIDSLFRQSGLMREKWNKKHSSDGSTYGERSIAKAINQTVEVYSPPQKDPKEKDHPAASSPESEKESYVIGINLTDLGNGRRFVAAHGKDLRYCYPWGKWLSWDGQRWKVDDTGEVNRKAKDVVRLIYKDAAKEKDQDRRKALSAHALRCESDNKIKAMIELAKSEPGIPMLPDEMDRDPWLLNVANGMVNLLTGELHSHKRENLITKLAPVEYQSEAGCPYWKEHLKRIMDGNKDLISFLQRGYGYSLTGVTDERVILIQHGSGANGKTTTNEVISMVMGDYAVRTPTETLLVKREGAIPNDVAKLKGARFVFCSEADEGKRLGESLIKDLTGGDTIAARFMRGEWFEFQPSFKIWLATNHKPIIRGTDNAIWDRIRLIPFTVSIPEDERIPRREMLPHFEEELPGILAWMVQGCLDWQRIGLGTPQEVKEATGQYREEMDLIGEFINECCVVSNTEETSAKQLYEKYCKWSEANGEKPIAKRTFGTRLTERGFLKGRASGGTRQWKGIGVESDVSDT